MMLAKLHFESWPEADRRFWLELTQKGHPLDAAGTLSHLRTPTLNNMMVSYGRWLFWLSSFDLVALAEPPNLRITEARVVAWIASYPNLAAYSRKMYLDDLIRILTAADPDRPTIRLRRLRKLLNCEAQVNSGSRKIGRIPSTVDLISAAIVYSESSVSIDISDFDHARRLRDAAMVAFLATAPRRRKNFATLELGRTITIDADFIEVALPPDEVKNGRGHVFTLQEPAASLLRRYISEARPFFAARKPGATSYLWLADTGRPYALNYLTTRITKLTERFVGLKVPPHFFRDAVATTMTRASADLARGVPAILGHTNARTSERHYNHARMIEAGRDFAELLRDARREGNSSV